LSFIAISVRIVTILDGLRNIRRLTYRTLRAPSWDFRIHHDCACRISGLIRLLDGSPEGGWSRVACCVANRRRRTAPHLLNLVFGNALRILGWVSWLRPQYDDKSY
jgi:hypothetical protein